MNYTTITFPKIELTNSCVLHFKRFVETILVTDFKIKFIIYNAAMHPFVIEKKIRLSVKLIKTVCAKASVLELNFGFKSVIFITRCFH